MKHAIAIQLTGWAGDPHIDVTDGTGLHRYELLLSGRSDRWDSLFNQVAREHPAADLSMAAEHGRISFKTTPEGLEAAVTVVRAMVKVTNEQQIVDVQRENDEAFQNTQEHGRQMAAARAAMAQITVAPR